MAKQEGHSPKPAQANPPWSNETKELLLDWLKGDLDDAKQDDPSVGIFVNEDLVKAFKYLISIVEDM